MSWIDERRQILRILVDRRVREDLEIEARGNDVADRGPCLRVTENGYLCTHRESTPGSGICGSHAYLERKYGEQRRARLEQLRLEAAA